MGWMMFKSMKCLLKGHLYVDSRSQPGTRVCVRCKDRQPFEGKMLESAPGASTNDPTRQD